MLRKIVYPKIEGLLTEAARWVDNKKISPNQLTLIGLGLSFVSGWIYSTGHFFWGGILLLFASLADLLDGSVARLTGKVTKFGAFFDSTIDRYADFFLFGGIAFYLAGQNNTGLLILTLGTIVGSFVTSYAKARAENLITECNVGVFERAERLIGLGVISLFPSLLTVVLWILFIGTNATAIQRIWYTQKILSGNSKSS